jgi:hypothetical protein
VIGGALGFLFAYGGLRVLIALAPSNLPRLSDIGIDSLVLGTSSWHRPLRFFRGFFLPADAVGYTILQGLDFQVEILSDLRSLIRTLRPMDCGKEVVRIGGDRDGGYLIPSDLEGLKFCFSPGVGLVADFENHLADLGIRSFLADYSVTRPVIARPEFAFDKKYLGALDNERYMTLSSWKRKYLGAYSGDLLLQMDIEGGEYDVLCSTPDELIDQFRIIVIEFHYLHMLVGRAFFRLFETCLRRLLRYFYIVHLHPNNCCGSISVEDIDIPKVIEFTFYNKKRVSHTMPATLFPHPLDRDNVPENSSLPLPRCWYI